MAKTNKDYDKEYMYKKIMPSAFLEKENQMPMMPKSLTLLLL